MLKSYYCVTYNFKTKDDARIIYLRVILYTENGNIHKCNSRLIIAISREYNFIEYTMDYLSPSHLDKCGAEDKITRYGYRHQIQSNPIKIHLRHFSVDNRSDHPHFNFIEDTFNTLEEKEILPASAGPVLEELNAVEIVHKYTVDKLEYPPICLYTLE